MSCDEAIAHYLDLYAKCETARDRATALFLATRALVQADRLGDAVAAATRALQLCRDVDDDPLLRAGRRLGKELHDTVFHDGFYSLALPLSEALKASGVRLGLWTRMMDEVRRLRSVCELGRGDEAYAGAELLVAELRTLREPGELSEEDPPSEVRKAVFNVAELAAKMQQRWKQALAFNAENVRAWEADGAPDGVILSMRRNAVPSHLALGEHDAARTILEENRVDCERRGDQRELGRVLTMMAHAELHGRRWEVAAQHALSGLRLGYEVGEPRSCSDAHFMLAMALDAQRTDSDRAAAHYLAALVLSAQTAGLLPEQILEKAALRFDQASTRVRALDSLCEVLAADTGGEFRRMTEALAPDGAQALQAAVASLDRRVPSRPFPDAVPHLVQQVMRAAIAGTAVEPLLHALRSEIVAAGFGTERGVDDFVSRIADSYRACVDLVTSAARFLRALLAARVEGDPDAVVAAYRASLINDGMNAEEAEQYTTGLTALGSVIADGAAPDDPDDPRSVLIRDGLAALDLPDLLREAMVHTLAQQVPAMPIGRVTPDAREPIAEPTEPPDADRSAPPRPAPPEVSTEEIPAMQLVIPRLPPAPEPDEDDEDDPALDPAARVTAVLEQGAAYFDDGDYREALRVATRAGALADELLDANHLLRASCINSQALALKRLGEHDAAGPLFEQALAILERAGMHDHPEYAVVKANFGGFLMYTERYVEAEPVLRDAQRLLAATVGEATMRYASCLNDRAIVADALGAPDAEALGIQAAEAFARCDAPEAAAAAFHRLACVHLAQGDNPRAIALLRQAVERLGAVRGRDSRIYAEVALQLAELLRDAGQIGESRQILEEIFPHVQQRVTRDPREAAVVGRWLAIQRAGSDGISIKVCLQAFLDRDYARCIATAEALLAIGANRQVLLVLVVSLFRTGRADDAERRGREFLAAVGESDPWCAVLLRLVLGLEDAAGALRAAGSDVDRCQAQFYAGVRMQLERRSDLAASHFDACLALGDLCWEFKFAGSERGVAPDTGDPRLTRHAEAQARIGNLAASGRLAEALVALRDERAAIAAEFGTEDPVYADCLCQLADVHADLGQLADAVPLLEAAMPIYRARLGNLHRKVLELLGALANAYRAVDRYDEAVQCLQERLAAIEARSGSHHPSGLDTLARLVVTHHAAGQHREAAECFDRAMSLLPQIELRAQIYDEGHDDALNDLGRAAQILGRYTEAGRCLELAVKAAVDRHGPDHRQTAVYLAQLGNNDVQLGRYLSARERFERAIAILEAAPAKERSGLGAVYDRLASVHRVSGDLEAAERFARAALSEADGAEDAPLAIDALISLAGICSDSERHDEAERCLTRALDLCDRAPARRSHLLVELASHHVARNRVAQAEAALREAAEVAGSVPKARVEVLAALAGLRQRQGSLDEAVRLCQECLYIASGSGLPASTWVEVVVELAEAYCYAGNSADARQHCRDALRRLDETHTAIPALETSLLDMLARACVRSQDLEQAIAAYERVLEIRRRTLGETHIGFAYALMDLASTRNQLLDQRSYIVPIAMHQREELLAMYEQALAILSRNPAAAQRSMAGALNNCAELLSGLGAFEQAETAYRLSLAMMRSRDQSGGALAFTMDNLARLLIHRQRFLEAEPLIREALELLHGAGADGERDEGTCQYHLAAVCVATARFDEARRALERAAVIDDRELWRIATALPEGGQHALVARAQKRLWSLLSLYYQYPSGGRGTEEKLLEHVLRRKGIGLEIAQGRRDLLMSRRHPSVEHRLSEWRDVTGRIAQLQLERLDRTDDVVRAALLDSLGRRAAELEREIAVEIPEIRLQFLLTEVSARTVASALPPGSVLLEFVRFDVNDLRPQPDAAGRLQRYLAFVLPADEPHDVQLIDLGDAEVIDGQIARFRDAVALSPADRGRASGDARDAEALSPADRGRASGDAARELRAAVLDPLASAIGARRHLVVAPDGDLNRVPFEVLPDDAGRPLVEDYRVSYVTCGRDLLRFDARSAHSPGTSVVIADPAFNLTAESAEPPGGSEPVSQQSRDLDRGMRFWRLRHTRVEGQEVARLLGVQPWLEAEALEGRLKQQRSPRFLHLATHGFFLPKDASPASLLASPDDDLAPRRIPIATIENPMLRSGLALAGANIWLRGGSPPRDAEDGLLTAADVAQMDLVDTELVVLSACETGLGDIRVGEGVFGLRRAFVLSGARALVMSLWKVPDAQTCELMTDFYQRLLDGQDVADALRAAQTTLRTRHADPYYWGAFICQGDTRPLAPAGGEP